MIYTNFFNHKLINSLFFSICNSSSIIPLTRDFYFLYIFCSPKFADLGDKKNVYDLHENFFLG
jgi:hypothetical protein